MPGPGELIIILVIALLILGPGKLPDVGAALGRSIREFRKASSDVQEATRIDTSPIPPSTPTTASPAAPPTTATLEPRVDPRPEPRPEPSAEPKP